MLTSILTKKLEETIFWFTEWITSVTMDEATEQIWKIYYDFYSIKNPKIEKYIQRKVITINKSSEKSDKIKHFANIIKNLLVCESSCDVFILRQYMRK